MNDKKLTPKQKFSQLVLANLILGFIAIFFLIAFSVGVILALADVFVGIEGILIEGGAIPAGFILLVVAILSIVIGVQAKKNVGDVGKFTASRTKKIFLGLGISIFCVVTLVALMLIGIFALILVAAFAWMGLCLAISIISIKYRKTLLA